MSRIEHQRRCFISFIPDNSHYILIKSKKKKEKVMAIKKMLTLRRVVKRFMYQTIIIQCSKPSFPSLENGFDGVRENISFPVSFCVSNLVSSNNLLTHRRYFSLKPLFFPCSVRAWDSAHPLKAKDIYVVPSLEFLCPFEKACHLK